MKKNIGCCTLELHETDKRMTHRADYGLDFNDRPSLPRDDAGLAISDTTNKANETGLIFRQPL